MKLFAVLAALTAFFVAYASGSVRTLPVVHFDAQASGGAADFVRYGGLYDFSAHAFAGVVGIKVHELDLRSKWLRDPEVWALGGATVGSGRSRGTFNAAVAEPWSWTPTVTAYPLVSLGIADQGRWHLGLGAAIQFRFKS